MQKVADLMTELEDQALQVNERGQVQVDKQAQAAADALRDGVRLALVATGVDASNFAVKAEAANTDSSAQISAGEISVELATMTSGSAAEIAHALTNAVGANENQDRGDNAVIEDQDFARALNEGNTAIKLSNTAGAHQENTHTIDEVAGATGQTRGVLLELFQDGQNARLNDLQQESEKRLAA